MDKHSSGRKRGNSFLDLLKAWQTPSERRRSGEDVLLDSPPAEAARAGADRPSVLTGQPELSPRPEAVIGANGHRPGAAMTLGVADAPKNSGNSDGNGDAGLISAMRLAPAIKPSAVNQVSATLDQWADGPAPDGDSSGQKDEAWVNGNLNASKAHYNEGDAVPYRALLDNLVNGTRYGLQIQWDTVDSGALAYALDYLVGYNFSFEGLRHSQEPDADPLKGIQGLSASAVNAAIPGDNQLLAGFGYGSTDGLGSTKPSGDQSISLYGVVGNATVDSISYSSDLRKASTTIWFTYAGTGNSSGPDVVVAWGGHIAAATAWADDPGESVITASAISGSPYHMRILSMAVDTTPGTGPAPVVVSIGNQDRSLSADAVEIIPPPEITPPVLVLDDEILLGGIKDGPDDGTPEGDLDPEASPSPVATYTKTGALPRDGATASDTTLLTSVDPSSTVPDLQADLSPDGKLLKVWQVNNGSLDDPVITLALADATSGAYTLKHLKPLIHSVGNTEDDLLLKVEYTVVYASLGGATKVVPLSILIDDDVPIALSVPVTATVDEDGSTAAGTETNGLPGSNPGGSGDLDAGTTATGSLAAMFAIGADGPGTYSLVSESAADTAITALGLTSGGLAIDVVTIVSGLLTASTSAGAVFSFEITNNLTGDYTFKLLNSIDHASGGNENELVLNLGAIIQASDVDADTVVGNPGALQITVDDDTPEVSGTAVSETVDEDELSTGITDGDATTTTATFTGAQIQGLVNSGADEPVTISFNSDIDGIDTGLDSKGVNIVFDVISATQVNGVAGGRTVFTIVQSAGDDAELGTADDVMTFTLLDQVDHTPLATGGGDEETIELSLANVFKATDFDGDSIVIDAGAAVTIENDVPGQNTISININVDEDELSTGITDGDATTTTATFTGAQIQGLVNSGADEPVTISFNSDIDGIDTGLDSKGVNIVFDVISATQVNGVAGGRTVFTIVQSAGDDAELGTADDVMTFTLLDQVDHTPLATGGGDEETIELSLANVFKATDFDGDSIVIDAGAAVTIENDVPGQNTISININVDEDELSTGITDGDATTTTATFTGAQIQGLVNSGADEPVTISFNSDIDGIDTGLDSKGVNIVFDVISATQVNGVAGGRTVFTIVQSAGDDAELGTADDVMTFTLLDQVDHTPLATGGGDEETIELSLANVFKATDFDGDSIVIDAGAAVTIENDVPGQNTISININVDEDELSTGITDGDATTTTATFTGAQIQGLVNSGADEPVTISFNSDIDGIDTGLDSKGVNIVFDVISATQVNGVAGGRTVFTIVQSAGDDAELGTADDVMTFTLLDQVDHTPLATGGGDEETIELSLANVFKATDFDGDSIVIDAGAAVTIENDVPGQNTISININVDEDELSTGITDGDATTTTATFTGAQIQGLVNSGADEPVTISFNSDIDGIDTGLDSKGVNIVFDVISATQVNGVAGGRTVFTIVQSAGDDAELGTADDVMTFTLLDQVDHTPLATGGGDEETIELSLANVFKATDFDGDSIVIDAGAAVTIENDVPGQNTISININVDEDELSTGITDGDATTTTATFTGAQIQGLVNSGADEPVTISFNSDIDGIDTGLDSKGVNIVFDVISATQVNGVAGGRTVFTIVQSAGDDAELGTADDVMTFTLLDQVDHTPLATGGGDEETIELSLANVFKATDFDGDSIVIDAGAAVTIENDVPGQNTISININVDEDELSTGITDGDATTTTATFTGAQIQGLVNSGADEPVTISFNSDIDGIDTGLDSKGVNIVFDVISATQVNGVAGGRTVFTIVQSAGDDAELGTADDVMTFTLLDQVDHTPLATGGGDEETIELSLANVFKATDFDGDSIVIDAGAAVTIENDILSVTAKTDLIFSNSSNPAPGGTGIFRYAIGADERSTFDSLNSDFSTITLAGSVGKAAITGSSVTRELETSSQAVFNFQFNYQADPNSTATTPASGTIAFDKLNETYTVSLAQPLSGYTVLTTGQTESRESFNIIGSSSSQPEVVVSKLADDFYVRFSAYAAVAGGSSATPLRAGTEPIQTNPRDVALNGDASYAAGDVFQAYWSWASISGDSNGVASDTIQAGEVLDMGFYLGSPGGDLPEPDFPTTRADAMYLKVAGLGAGEDLVVLLKLVNKSDPLLTTTRAIVVDYGDVYLGTEDNPYGITFTGPNPGNQGLIVVESNDYNTASGDSYQIYGAQLLVSTEGVSGSGIDLVRTTGDLGGSTETQAFVPGGVTDDNDVIKIVDIGFVQAGSGTLNADLSFGFSLVDADGDATDQQTLNVGINGGMTFQGTASSEAIQGSSANDLLIGAGGKDLLTGGAGTNTFVYAGLSDSLLADYDVITDFKVADKLDAPAMISGTLNSSIGVVASDFSNISTVLSSLGAGTAAAFTVAGQSGTFVALSDGTAGFNPGDDAIIFLKNYTLGTVSIV